MKTENKVLLVRQVRALLGNQEQHSRFLAYFPMKNALGLSFQLMGLSGFHCLLLLSAHLATARSQLDCPHVLLYLGRVLKTLSTAGQNSSFHNGSGLPQSSALFTSRPALTCCGCGASITLHSFLPCLSAQKSGLHSVLDCERKALTSIVQWVAGAFHLRPQIVSLTSFCFILEA